MFTRILVPLDGSPLAERAIPHASHFAKIFGGSIVLLQVLDPSPYRENAGAIEPLNWQIRKSEADLYMKKIAERVRDQGIQAEHVLREGRAAENIVDYAHNENIDLLVLTTHGAGGLSRWNISSVLSKVIDKIYLPVLVIRAFQSSGQDQEEEAINEQINMAEPASIPGINTEGRGRSSGNDSIPVTSGGYIDISDSGIHYCRVLIPIDNSRRAECSFPAGIRLVESERELYQLAEGQSEEDEEPELVLVSIIKPPELPVPMPYPEELQQLSDRFMEISRKAVREYLYEVQSRLPVKTEIHILENESISASIHETVEKMNIDLVVFCAHGKTGRIYWPYGSVSRNYIEHGTKPVLIIQDVPRAQVQPTSAEIAAKKYGRR